MEQMSTDMEQQEKGLHQHQHLNPHHRKLKVTFKDLQKAVQSNGQQNYSIDLQERLQGKPFWIFDKEAHRLEDIRTKGQCCLSFLSV